MDKSILELCSTLAEEKEEKRMSAVISLSDILISKQINKEAPCKEVDYTLKRLIRGLSSSRRFARIGYSTALSRILRDCETISFPLAVKTISTELQCENSATKSEKSHVALGRVLAFLALIQADGVNKSTNDELKHLVEEILKIQKQKAPLHNVCTHALVQIISQVEGGRFTAVVWPLLQEALSCGWEDCSPDALLLLITTAKAHKVGTLSCGWEDCSPDALLLLITTAKAHKDVVNKAFLSKHWSSKKLLAETNLPAVANVVSKSTCDHPIIHPVCSVILQYAAEKDHLKSVWEHVVSGILFDKKKDAVDELCIKLTPVALNLADSSDVINVILSPKMIGYFLRQLTQKKCLLHRTTQLMVDDLQKVMTSWSDADMQITMVTCFLKSPAGVLFDNVSQSSTVTNLVRNMSKEGAEKFAGLLMNCVTGKETLGVKTEDSEDIAKFAIGQLCHMTTIPSMATDCEWQLGLLCFLCLHGSFKIEKANKNITHCQEVPSKELSTSLQKAVFDAFKQALGKLSTFQAEKGAKNKNTFLQLLRGVVKYSQELLDKPKHFSLVKPFSSATRDQWKKVIEVTQSISNKSDSDAVLPEHLVFEQALLQMALELFTDADDAGEVLQDLFVCHEKAFQKKKKSKKNEEEPEWIEVLTELLLSLLSRPSQLHRNVVTAMFTVVCSHLTPAAFQLIIDSIHSVEGEDGPLDFDNGDDDDGVEMLDEKENGDTEKDGDDSEDSDSSESEDSDSDDDSPDAEVNDSMRANVKAALGHAAVSSEAESDADLSDSEMEKLDHVIGSAFASMRKGKKGDKEKIGQLKAFKMRCFDLLDILIQNENTNVRYLVGMLEPLIALMDSTQKDKDQREVQVRAGKLYRALCRAKPQKPESTEELPDRLRHFIQLSTKVTGVPMVTEVAHAIVFVAKLMMTSQTQPASGADVTPTSRKKKRKVETSQDTLNSILKEAIEDFIQKRDTLLNHSLFTTVFAGLPALVWPLIDDLLLTICDGGARVYRRTQLCCVLSSSIGKASVNELGEESWKETASKIVEKLTKLLDDAAAKNKFLFEILTVLHKVFTVSDTETSKEMMPSDFVEKLNGIQKSGKINTDLKRVCNKLKQLLIRLFPDPESKQKRKRKNSASAAGGTNQNKVQKGGNSESLLDSEPVNGDTEDMDFEEDAKEDSDANTESPQHTAKKHKKEKKKKSK